MASDASVPPNKSQFADPRALPALHQIASLWTRTDDPKAALREVLDLFIATFQAQAGSISLLSPDTGHLAWGGADVVQFCRDYADSIKTIHIKDIDPRVRAEGVASRWDYATFSANGIFTEIGEGLVDFPAIFAILREANFTGWVIAETDVTQQPSALASATISRNNLHRWGL